MFPVLLLVVDHVFAVELPGCVTGAVTEEMLAMKPTRHVGARIRVREEDTMALTAAASPGYRPVSLGSWAGRWLPASR